MNQCNAAGEIRQLGPGERRTDHLEALRQLDIGPELGDELSQHQTVGQLDVTDDTLRITSYITDDTLRITSYVTDDTLRITSYVTDDQGCARLMSHVAADSNYSRPARKPSAADTAGMRLSGQGQW